MPRPEFVLYNEKWRYTRKGKGNLIAALITIAWFFCVPRIIYYFYPEKIENEGVFVNIFGLLVHEGTHIISNLFFYFIYKYGSDMFIKYKVNTNPWPWEEDKEKWNKQKSRLIRFLVINHVFLLPMFGFYYLLTNTSPFSMQKADFPSSWELIWQNALFMVCEDFTFYWSHRLLHQGFLYNYIHKIHHEFSNTISFGTEFAHPLEFILGNVVTTSSGPFLLGKRCHFVSYCMFIALKTSESIEGHSGYEFPWSPYRLLPFSGSSDYHNFHHQNTKGNYSSCFTYWDTLCGTTNPSYLKYTKRKQEE